MLVAVVIRIVTPLIAPDDVYRALLQRIGLLSEAEVQKIMNACLMLRTYNTALFVFGTLTNEGRYVEIPSNSLPIFLKSITSLIDPIREAIAVMESAPRNNG